MTRRHRAVWVFAALVLAASSSSAADPSDSTNRAATLFREGRTLLSQGRFDLACKRFAESKAAEPTIGALINIADCHERSGRLLAARAACLEAHDLAVARSDSERATFAETRARELDERTPRVVIVAPLDDGAQLRITRDGTPVNEGMLGQPIAIDPGTHVIVAEAPGRAPYRSELSLSAGTPEVRVTIPRLARATLAADSADHSSTRPTAGLVLAGVGGAFVVASAIAGVLAFSSWDDVTTMCPEQQCPTSSARALADRTKDDASGFALASTIGFVVGGVLLAGGLYLYRSADRKSTTRTAP